MQQDQKVVKKFLPSVAHLQDQYETEIFFLKIEHSWFVMYKMKKLRMQLWSEHGRGSDAIDVAGSQETKTRWGN